MPRTRKAYTTSKAGELATRRVAAGFSQIGAAEKLGIARVSLVNVERGSVGASMALLERMAKLYGLSIDVVKRAYRVDRVDWATREGLRR